MVSIILYYLSCSQAHWREVSTELRAFQWNKMWLVNVVYYSTARQFIPGYPSCRLQGQCGSYCKLGNLNTIKSFPCYNFWGSVWTICEKLSPATCVWLIQNLGEAVGEVLVCEREPQIAINRYAVVVKKNAVLNEHLCILLDLYEQLLAKTSRALARTKLNGEAPQPRAGLPPILAFILGWRHQPSTNTKG